MEYKDKMYKNKKSGSSQAGCVKSASEEKYTMPGSHPNKKYSDNNVQKLKKAVMNVK